LLLELDGRGPRYGQISRALLQSIQAGVLIPGSRLRSTRQLAAELCCSRNIVVLAYEQLILEGYLVPRPKSGTFVSPELPRSASLTRLVPARYSYEPTKRLSRNGQRLARIAEQARVVTRGMGQCAIDFMYGICEPDPRFVRRLQTSFSAAVRKGVFGYGDPAGDLRLREQIAERLHGTRGISCSPSQIVVTNGAQQGLDICARLLLTDRDRAVVEDPGYEVARAVFAAAGATIVPVAVDAEGLDPSKLPKDDGRVRIVYVTPSHQFPTGATLSAPRRHALLAWARLRGAFVIEDDYDGDLRYQGGPLKALAGLEPRSDVIYCGTFAKSLFPAVRLGYLVLPGTLAEAVINAKWLTDRGSSLLLQHVVGDLMVSGEYDRHISRMKRRYSVRRDQLIRALRHYFGDDVEVAGGAAGLHLVAWLPRLRPEDMDALVARCADRGIGVYSVARHALRPLRRPGLIIGYGLTDEDAIARGVRGMAAAYRGVRAR
jgi:GntR family transcriptional regulator/MocR family aminotransferase